MKKLIENQQKEVAKGVAEVQENLKEIENKKQKRERLKAMHRYKGSYLRSWKKVCETSDKTREELKIQANNYWKSIQELVKDENFSYWKAIRTKVDFCKLIDKKTNIVHLEGTTKEIYEHLELWFWECFRYQPFDQYYYYDERSEQFR